MEGTRLHSTVNIMEDLDRIFYAILGDKHSASLAHELCFRMRAASLEIDELQEFIDFYNVDHKLWYLLNAIQTRFGCFEEDLQLLRNLVEHVKPEVKHDSRISEGLAEFFKRFQLLTEYKMTKFTEFLVIVEEYAEIKREK